MIINKIQKIFFLLLSLFWTLSAVCATEKVSITDMGGREVTIPAEVNSVLSRSPIGTILMYSLNPAKVTGLSWTPTKDEKHYLDKKFINLPVLSGWYGDGKVGNVEEIVKASPDVIFSSFFNKPSNGVIAQADRIQAQLDIPVVLINAGLEYFPETYQFIGALVNENKRSQKLAQYSQRLLADVKSKTAKISKEMQKTLYYAEGPAGLQTDPAGSWHTRVIDFIHAKNIAKVEIKSGVGRASVSAEQLLQWDPDVIIACHDQGFAKSNSTYDAVLADPRLASLSAIENNKIFEVPYKPFNFMDRPPSINRLLGLKWLGHLLYPEIFNYEIRKEIKEFYQVFYKIELSQEQLDDILKYSK